MVRYKTARTKFVKGEIMTGKKYLFHSIRYRIFASQIAEKVFNITKFIYLSNNY